MKTYTLGMILAAILMVSTGAGFGIAHAGGTHAEIPVSNLPDQGALEKSGPASPEVAGPISTGKVPEMSDAEFAKVAEAERKKYQGMPDIDGH
ncbi:MAG: hypothetical protein IH588_14505 [Anaerolineales bacterium]|nr:hypothetical protein [Anaerolineales bacterium]